MEQPGYQSIRHAAAAVGVHPATLARWEREGAIPPAIRRRGRRVYTVADVERIKAAVLEVPADHGREELAHR